MNLKWKLPVLVNILTDAAITFLIYYVSWYVVEDSYPSSEWCDRTGRGDVGGGPFYGPSPVQQCLYRVYALQYILIVCLALVAVVG
jgi:hypothetical protein